MGDEVNVLKVALEILKYMRRFPDAADTEEHIIHWWLSTAEIEQELGVVSSALQMLETKEFIERVELPDKRLVYRVRIIP